MQKETQNCDARNKLCWAFQFFGRIILKKYHDLVTLMKFTNFINHINIFATLIIHITPKIYVCVSTKLMYQENLFTPL